MPDFMIKTARFFEQIKVEIVLEKYILFQKFYVIKYIITLFSVKKLYLKERKFAYSISYKLL
jgi:hypothetical protein